MASMLPAPRRVGLRSPSTWLKRRSRRLLDRMRAAGRITADEHLHASAELERILAGPAPRDDREEPPEEEAGAGAARARGARVPARARPAGRRPPAPQGPRAAGARHAAGREARRALAGRGSREAAVERGDGHRRRRARGGCREARDLRSRKPQAGGGNRLPAEPLERAREPVGERDLRPPADRAAPRRRGRCRTGAARPAAPARAPAGRVRARRAGEVRVQRVHVGLDAGADVERRRRAAAPPRAGSRGRRRRRRRSRASAPPSP